MSHNTAITRKRPSAPMKYLEAQGLITGERQLDYGCGRGFDARYYQMEGFDPHWKPGRPQGEFDLIVCNYVLNVITEETQEVVLEDIKSLLAPGGVAFFSVRRDLPKEGKPGRGCFQRHVELDFDLVVENSSFAIFKMASLRG